MNFIFDERPSDSPFVEMIWRTQSEHNLIDDYWFLVYPLVLGSGKRLFKDGSKATLKLVETKAFGSGVVFLSYQSAPRE